MVAAGVAGVEAAPSDGGLLVRPLSLTEDLAYWRRLHASKEARAAKRQGRPAAPVPAQAPAPAPAPGPPPAPAAPPATKRKAEAAGPSAKRIHVHFSDDEDA